MNKLIYILLGLIVIPGLIIALVLAWPQPSLPENNSMAEEMKNACIVTGCSGTICAKEEVFSTCQWEPQFACYQSANCIKHQDGSCGWEQTRELENCLNQANQEKNITAQVGKKLILELESNPSTGYLWQADYDEEFIEKLNQEFMSSSENNSAPELKTQTKEENTSSNELISVPGVEVFTFKPLQSGQTQIILRYTREWEGLNGAIKQRIYNLNIEE